jgi:hypothetical protein
VDLLDGRYEVLRTVSEGRRASVLQAIDRDHGRMVALKMHALEPGDDLDELRAEARVLMSIRSHPALPVVRHDFSDGERYVLVLDWIDGPDLQDVVDREGHPGLPATAVVDLLATVADALDHLHRHVPPVVHGDVKPSNVVRQPDGQVVLVDFDIAGTQPTGRMGTPGYVAPEVVAGEKAIPASDVYGLASTAAALLTGAPPDEPGAPTGLPPAAERAVADVLRLARSTDPRRRPATAGDLVLELARAIHSALPIGRLVFLAGEVADADDLWEEHPDEMEATTARLRDAVTSTVRRHGGTVVTSMTEGQRAIAVFDGVAAAARTALALHESAASQTRWGFAPQLRLAVHVGDPQLSDGVYTGAVVDRVLWLRSITGPGTTTLTEPAVDELGDALGDDVSIVALGTVVPPGRTEGRRISAVTAPGTENRAGLTVPVAEPAEATNTTGPVPPVKRRQVIEDALLHPSTLVPLTAVGVALIFLVVLADPLGLQTLAAALVLVGAVWFVGAFGVQYTRAHQREVALVQASQLAADAAEAEVRSERERREVARGIENGFMRLGATTAVAAVHALTTEFESLRSAFRRGHDGAPSLSSVLPALVDETYQRGMSALSDALQLCEVAEGRERRRLEDEFDQLEERLRDDLRPDGDPERRRDEQRRDGHERRIAELDELREHSRELVFQAERCQDGLHSARIELASLRAGTSRIEVDAVVDTLEENIRRVREVQDDFRRLGY